MNFNRLISLLLLIAFYSPAWDLGTIWAPFTAKAPPTQAIKETPRTRKNVVFMRVSGVFQSLNRPEIILCKRELFYYFLLFDCFISPPSLDSRTTIFLRAITSRFNYTAPDSHLSAGFAKDSRLSFAIRLHETQKNCSKGICAIILEYRLYNKRPSFNVVGRCFFQRIFTCDIFFAIRQFIILHSNPFQSFALGTS